MNNIHHRINAWGELLRLPNMFTLPGDVLAGYFAGASAAGTPAFRILAAVGVSVLLYAAGLVLNDVVDLETDRAERPARPLPSGRISIKAALSAAVILMLIALPTALLCSPATFKVAALLCVLIIVYNGAAKRNRLTGAVTMGACRGLNVMLGASITAAPVFSGRVLFPVLAIGGAIAVITWIAAGEMSGRPVGALRWLPAATGLICITVFLHATHWIAAAIALAALTDHALTGQAAGAGTADIPRQIGRWIRGMIVLQAAFCAAAACPSGYMAAGALLTMRPLSALAGRTFYGS